MSTAIWLEVAIVADQRSAGHGEGLNALVEALQVALVPVSARHAEVARMAYRRSVVSGEPLLFTGEDFAHTDIAAAIS